MINNFIIIIVLCSLSILILSPIYAQDEKKENSNKQHETPKKQKKKFVPSEKIDADSSVSFPVDI